MYMYLCYRYQHYAEDHGIPVTKLFRPKKFLEFPSEYVLRYGQLDVMCLINNRAF